jgi:hypothetical protein
LPGDYNHDELVDGADLLAWQRALGSRTPALRSADGNGNLQVDGGDLAVWSANYDEQSAAAVVAPAEPAGAGPQQAFFASAPGAEWFVSTEMFALAKATSRQSPPPRSRFATELGSWSSRPRPSAEVPAPTGLLRSIATGSNGRQRPEHVAGHKGWQALDMVFADADSFRWF